MKIKFSLIGLLIIMSAQLSFAQNSKTEQHIIDLSKEKWQWMADKNVEKLEPLFHDESKFVHMSGTWKKDEELDIIKTGSIWKLLALTFSSVRDTHQIVH